VDDTADAGSDYWEAATKEKGDHHAQWDWGEEAFSRFAELVAAGGPTTALADHQLRLWRSVVERLPQGGNGLVVTHGGLIEPGLVMASPKADHATWGPAIGHCEGARLSFLGSRVVQVDLLRLDGTIEAGAQGAK